MNIFNFVQLLVLIVGAWPAIMKWNVLLIIAYEYSFAANYDISRVWKSWSTVDEYQPGICCSRPCWLPSIYSAGVTMEERASTNNFSYLYIDLKWQKEKCWRNCKHNHSPSFEANWNESRVKVCQWKAFHYFVKFKLTKRR